MDCKLCKKKIRSWKTAVDWTTRPMHRTCHKDLIEKTMQWRHYDEPSSPLYNPMLYKRLIAPYVELLAK